MNASTISAKIKNSLQILKDMYGVSETELCRETNISQATLWRLLNSETDPRASTLSAIASFFNISVDQLLGNKPIVKVKSSVSQNQNDNTFIPLYSLEKQNELGKMIGNTTPGNWNKWLEVETSIKNSCFAVEIIGDSMWPDFIEGTLIIVDPTITPKHRNYVLCKLHKNNEIIFRQLIEERAEKLLKPINYAYKTIPFQKNDTIMGVITQSRNKFIE